MAWHGFLVLPRLRRLRLTALGCVALLLYMAIGDIYFVTVDSTSRDTGHSLHTTRDVASANGAPRYASHSQPEFSIPGASRTFALEHSTDVIRIDDTFYFRDKAVDYLQTEDQSLHLQEVVEDILGELDMTQDTLQRIPATTDFETPPPNFDLSLFLSTPEGDLSTPDSCNVQLGGLFAVRQQHVALSATVWGIEILAGNSESCPSANRTSVTDLYCVFVHDSNADSNSDDGLPSSAGQLLFSRVQSTGPVSGSCVVPPQLSLPLEARYGLAAKEAVLRPPDNVLSWSAGLPRGLSMSLVSSTGAVIQRNAAALFPRVSSPPFRPYCLLGATLVLNEAVALPPWLVYHFMLGFEHFIVYDDGSSDDTERVLRPFVEAHLVTIVRWGRTGVAATRQVAAMEHFRLQFAQLARLVSFFDVDEYYVPGEFEASADNDDDINDVEPHFENNEAPQGDACSVTCSSCVLDCPEGATSAYDSDGAVCVTSCTANSNEAFCSHQGVIDDVIKRAFEPPTATSRNCSFSSDSEGSSPSLFCSSARTECGASHSSTGRVATTCVTITATCAIPSSPTAAPFLPRSLLDGALLHSLHMLITPQQSKGQVVVAWSLFGSSNYETLEETDLLAIQAYTHRHPDRNRESLHRPLDSRLVYSYKSIALTQCIVAARGMVHKWLLVPACGDVRPHAPDQLTLNHYYTKSRADWAKRVREGWTSSWKESNWNAADAGLNQVEDLSIQRFVGRLRELMAVEPAMLPNILRHLAPRPLASDDAVTCPNMGLPKWKIDAVKAEEKRIKNLIDKETSMANLRKLDIDEEDVHAHDKHVQD